MKKVLVLIVALVMVVSLVSCSGKTTDDKENATDNNLSDGYTDDYGDDYSGDEEFVDTDDEYNYLDLNYSYDDELEEFDSANKYKMDLQSSGLVQVNFVSPHKSNGQIGGRYKIHMFYKEYGENISLFYEEYLGSDYEAQLCYFRLSKGEYYIVVSADESDVPEFGYTIRVDYLEEEFDYGVEKEFNDCFETANDIILDTEVTGNINAYSYYIGGDIIFMDEELVDNDYYRFSLDSETVLHLQVRVSNYSTDKFGFCLYDSDGVCIMNGSASKSGFDDESILSFKTMRLSAGDYYVGVSDGDDSEYHFTVVTE